MQRKRWFGLSLAVALGVVSAAEAQVLDKSKNENPASVPQSADAAAVKPVYTISPDGQVRLSDVMPAQYVPDGAGAAEAKETAVPAEAPAEEPPLGPTPPENVKLLMDTGVGQWLDELGTRAYGWLDMGYTFSTSGPGIMTTETRENRFGNEFLVNQLAFVLERPLKKDELSWGFNATYYAGADAALLQPKGGMDDPPGDPRFSHDFRQLYLSAHLPILSDGGVDLKLGRMGTIIGYESALAPYRPFYSNDYQWFYSQDGAWTGMLSNWHVNPQLDVLNGITWGANTFFTKRSNNSICYIGQVNYWLQEDKQTLLSASLHLGENAIFAAPGLAGDFDTIVELRIQHKWSRYLEMILQSDMGWDSETPVGTGQWYSFMGIFIYHATCKMDVNLRGEWFDDVNGTRTGFETAYGEFTFGLDYHPYKWISIRPEARIDSSDDARAFNDGSDKTQFTAAVDVLLKF